MAGLAKCLYSLLTYRAPFLMFGFCACLPRDLWIYLQHESLPAVRRANVHCPAVRSELGVLMCTTTMGRLAAELHLQLPALSCLVPF